MARLILLIGNGFTIDLISKLERNDINTKNLFFDGDLVIWPDGQGRRGFLSYRNCKSLWSLGARPHMDDAAAQEIIEEIISCANTLTRSMIDVKNIECSNIYRSAYYELIAYLKHLFIMYDKKVDDKELTCEKINEWGWYKLINDAYRSDSISEIDIVTYNYDIFLERVLRLHNIGYDIEGITGDGNKIKIYKPHGSISFCHKNKAERSMYKIRKEADMYEAQLSDFTVRYDCLDENYYVDAMIPPSGDSSRMTFQWAKDVRTLIGKLVNEMNADDQLVISGLSYWHVDRREIDEILVKAPSDMNVYMVNPCPPKSLEAVISCIFDKYVLLASSNNMEGIL